MDTKTLRIAKPHFLKDKKGNAIFAVLPIEEYNQMIDIVRLYEKEEYTPNAKTIRTIEKGNEEHQKGLIKGYTNAKEMFDDILNEGDE